MLVKIDMPLLLTILILIFVVFFVVTRMRK